jgi:hypothetical protein|tara:strand:+ start:4713 stop:4895 length:183 start_codon:yes stop_codon:yes gene_type:complete
MIKAIFFSKMSDYKVVDVILKIVLAGLFIMWVLGMAQLLYHLVTDPSSIENATFGIFDTL